MRSERAIKDTGKRRRLSRGGVRRQRRPDSARLSLELLEPRLVLDAGPLITEVMSNNENTLLDGDGHYSDWIELFNPTAEPLELEGWYLTDDSEDLTKWRIPPAPLDPGAYLVVFASGQDEADYVDPGGYLHTNFRLDADGDYLALVHPDGQTPAQQFAPLPLQTDDLSFGLPQQATSLVAASTPAGWLVPTDDALGSAWTAPDFDDDAWSTGETGLGFELSQDQSTAVAFANNAGNVGTQEYGGSLGHDFDVLAPIEVTRLGVFDSGGDGLFRTLTAQLWRRSGNSGVKLAELTFTPQSPGELIGGDRFRPLPAPLELAPGAYTMVAYGYGGGEPNGNEGTGGPSSADKSLDDGNDVLAFVGGARYGAAGSFPANVDGGPENRYSAGTFEYRAPAYTDLIATDVSASMHGRNSSLYARIAFSVSEASGFQSLSLRVKYDDGFIAYLNGQEVARRNAPSSASFDAQAESERPLEESRRYEEINITAGLGALDEGENILAIQALNLNAADPDFLVLPELVGVAPVDMEPVYFEVATPGSPNASESSFVGFVAEVSVDVDHGFYDAPFDVSLTTSTLGARIRYTLDGSAPTATAGFLYDRPLHIASQTTLRAAAFKEGLRPAAAVTRTYLFLDDVLDQAANPAGFPSTWNGVAADYALDQNPQNLARIAGDSNLSQAEYERIIKESLRSLPTMSIVMDVDDLFGSNGIYSNPTQRSDDWQRAASIEYILPDGGDGFQINAGLQILGGTSRNPSLTPKHSLRIVFKKEYGPGRLNYPLFADSDIDSYNTIALRANARDSWPASSGFAEANSSYIRDQWAKVALADMGALSTAGDFVHLYVNGLYWGLYNPTERPDAAFAEEHLGGKSEDYDVVKFCCPDRVVDGSMQKWNELLSLAQAGLASDAAYQFVQGNNPDGTRNPDYEVLLDVDNIIDYIINGQYHAANDWPGNYFALRRKGPESEGFQFFTWDNDLAFAYGNVNVDKTRSDNNSWWTESPGVVDLALRQNAEFRLRFADRVHQEFFHDGSLTPQAAAERWIRIADTVRQSMIAESARWGDTRGGLYTPEHWQSVVAGMLNNFFPRRTNIVLNQLRSRGLYPSVTAPEFLVDGAAMYGGSVAAGAGLSFAPATGTIYYTIDGSDPRLPGGALNAAAERYESAAFAVDDSLRLKARVLAANGQWSALADAVFAVDKRLRITELNYNPHAPTESELAVDPNFNNDDFEFIEVANAGAEPLDLFALHFAAGSPVDFTVVDHHILPPLQRGVLVRNELAFRARYGQEINILGTYSGGLSNGGEEIVLLDAADIELQRFDYDDDGAWPGRADGKGSTLEVVDIGGDYGDPQNWRASARYGGSPGRDGSESAPPVVINEVLTHTDPPLFDAIELYNPSAQDIDISGWLLSDSNDNYAKYQIPAETVLSAGAYLVFDERDFNASGGLTANDFALDGARGDDAWLLAVDQAGKASWFVDRLEFAAAANGESWGRWPNGIGDLAPMNALSLGEANPGPRVGPVIISEIMYHPSPAEDASDEEPWEYVELHNPQETPIGLGGWRLDGAVQYEFPLGVVIPPLGEVLVTAFDPTIDGEASIRFQQRYGAVSGQTWLGGYAGKLDNGGERLQLLRPDEPPLDDPTFVPYLLVDQVSFDDVEPWPVAADGSGQSLTRLAASAWGDDPLNWIASEPSPGTQSFLPRVRSVTINGEPADPPDLPAGAQPTSWSVQRSVLRSIQIAFDREVVVSVGDVRVTNLGVNAPSDADELLVLNAEQLSRQNNLLTIDFASVELADGVYRLDLLDSITDRLGNQLDGNDDGAAGGDYVLMGDATNRLHQLSGDWNGDRGVSIFDFPSFAYWFGQTIDNAPSYVDLNGDGGITIFDFPRFAANFGAAITYPDSFSPLLAFPVGVVEGRAGADATARDPKTDHSQLAVHDVALLDVVSMWSNIGAAAPRGKPGAWRIQDVGQPPLADLLKDK